MPCGVITLNGLYLTLASQEAYVLLLDEAESNMLSLATAVLVATDPTFRRELGTPQIWNRGFEDTVLRMMSANPDQFRRLFRMTTATFVELASSLWAEAYPHAPPWHILMGLGGDAARSAAQAQRWAHTHGPHIDPAHFRLRLLVTLYFLAHGVTYDVLSGGWGRCK